MSGSQPETAPMVVLIGPMGVGKTTVGQLLATSWGVTLRDTDHDIRTAEGRSVQDIFVADGERRFRELERDAVAGALAEHDGVLALGGGAVLDAGTRDRLAGHRVVFLQVGLAEAVKRVGLGSGRPLLLGNVRSQVKKLLTERAPVYAAAATLTIDTDGLSAEDVAEQIRTRLEENA